MACTINMGISIDSHLIHACTTEPSGQELLRSHECTPSSPEALLDTLKLMVEKSLFRFGTLGALTLSFSEYLGAANSSAIQRIAHELSLTFNATCHTVNHAQAASFDLTASQTRTLSISLGDGCGLAMFERGVMVPANNMQNWAHSELPDFDWIVDGLTPVCRCGGEQCVEQYLSVSGIERQYHQIVLKDKPLALIFAGVDRGLVEDTRVYRTFIDQLARSLSAPLSSLKPQTLLFSGEVVRYTCIKNDLVMALSRYIELALIPKNLIQQRDAFTFALGAALISEKNHNNRFRSA